MTNSRNILGRRIAVAVFCAGVLASAAGARTAAPVVVAGRTAASVRIVCAKGGDAGEMGAYLQKWLRDRGFRVQVALAPEFSRSYAGPQWALATSSTAAKLRVPGGMPAPPAGGRDEAYALRVSPAGGRSVVCLTGKTGSGLRAAVARLVGRVQNDGRTLRTAPGLERTDPFILLRLMNVGQAARRQAAPGSRFQDANYETWKLDRIRAYPEMIWQLGYNGIQVDECRGYGSISGAELARARTAVQTVSRAARARHMYVSLSQWGDTLFDESITYSWNNPKEQAVMRDFIKDMAQAYGALADNVAVRICDPGGCTRDGCDLYKTPQQITSAYLQEFRKVNPHITVTLSLWYNFDFWKCSPRKVDMSNLGVQNQAYGQPIPDGAKFLDSTFMPGDVGIALHRVYNEDQADMVVASGRPVDIKGWYIGDGEMNNNISLTMTTVDKLFSAYPAKAHQQVRSQTVEMCFHGWPQVINHYIAAHKLIDNHRPLLELEREFCTAAFGPQNAEAMVHLYQACENGGSDAIPHPKDFGTAAYNQHLRQVLAEAMTVKLVPGFKPNFAFPVPAQTYIDMLRARLRLTLAVSEAKEAVDAARTRLGISKTAINSVHLDLQDGKEQTVMTTGGRDINLSTRLEKGNTIGQSFTASTAFARVGVLCTRWGGGPAGFKMSLYDAPGGHLLASAVQQEVPDGEHCWLYTQQPAGRYYLELSDPAGDKVGVYNSPDMCPGGQLMTNRKVTGGDPEEILQIKQNAVKNMPKLPVDPIYSQDPSVVSYTFRTKSFADRIQDL